MHKIDLCAYALINIMQGFAMRDYIKERANMIALYIVENNATVRQAAKRFSVSKSTVHKDVSERLEVFNPSLYNTVRRILDVNKSERHLRGGIATREKYKKN